MGIENRSCDEPFSSAVALVLRAGMDDPVFRRAWMLAHRKNLDIASTLSFVLAFVTEPSGIQWNRLGHPQVEDSLAMCRSVRQVAALLARGQTWVRPLTADTIAHEADDRLLTYAAVRTFLPCGFDDVLATLGIESTIRRLNQFADIVDQGLTVG